MEVRKKLISTCSSPASRSSLVMRWGGGGREGKEVGSVVKAKGAARIASFFLFLSPNYPTAPHNNQPIDRSS
jgi:hypothetical protein